MRDMANTEVSIDFLSRVPARAERGPHTKPVGNIWDAVATAPLHTE